jgi:hypothetical protein
MGSCTAEANIDCQIDCQTEQYVECEEEMVETCETECDTTGGAIFCNGQFLAAEDIEDCADELAAEIEIEVDVRLEVDAEVDIDVNGNDDDEDEDGSDTINCSAVDASKPAGSGGSWFGLGLLGVACVLYRRSSKRSR